MFLTTEPGLSGKNYYALKVVHSICVQPFGGELSSSEKAVAIRDAIELALGAIQNEATKLGADGVIGIHHTVSSAVSYANAGMSSHIKIGNTFVVTVMGTAIKFY